jgi:hypothetical protein
MNTQEFLGGILSDVGHYCVFAARSKDDTRIQKFYDTLEEVERASQKFDADGFDVYFALSTFKEAGNRKGPNAHELKSLFLDLDCGPSKEYPSQKAAVDALRAFCKQLSLPKPLMVNSGRGVHVYWPLTETVSAAEWVVQAERLKQACADNGLLADPAVTSDVARILRVPFTHNYKGDPPLPVEFFGVSMPEPVVLEEFASKLGVLAKPVTTLDLGSDALLDAYVENSENIFKTIMKKTVEGRGCEQLKYIALQQEEVSEPLWRAGLSIAKFCSDGDKAAEKISNRHPAYNEADMRKKLDEIKGPYTCARFDELNEGTCRNCPLWGEIKSPIVLGKRIRQSEGDVVVSAPITKGGVKKSEEFEIPEYPNPYFRGAAGGVFIRSSNTDGDVEEEMIYHHDIYITRRLHDIELGETLVFRLHLPKDGVRQFNVPLTSITSREEFRKCMAKEGVTAFGKGTDKLMTYTTKWVDELQRTTVADEAHRQFGWADDNMDAFVLGDKLITATGTDFNPSSSPTAGLMDAFEAKGSRGKNLELLAFYDKPNYELHQYVVGVGFGSPLMALTGLNSMSIHLYGGSGVGKTTAQMAALGIWGSPDDLMNKPEDTHNSRMLRGEVMHNIPLVSDEMTNVNGEQMSDYVYQVSGGRQKNRMSGSGNTERARGKPWHLLALSSGNTSAWEILGRHKASPKAEMLRMFEIRVKKMGFVKGDNTDTASLISDFKSNYGHIGAEYIQWVMNNKDEVKRTVESVRIRLDKAAGLGPENRFWSNGNAVIIAGLIFAKKLGLVNYDVPAVYKWVVNELISRNSYVNDVGASVAETLNNYLSENYNNLLKIESTEDLRGKNDNGLDQLVPVGASPKGHLVARYEPDTKLLFLRVKPFRQWCVDQQINYQGVVDELKSKMSAKSMKKRLTKGTDFNMPPESVLVMEFTGLEDRSDGPEGIED